MSAIFWRAQQGASAAGSDELAQSLSVRLEQLVYAGLKVLSAAGAETPNPMTKVCTDWFGVGGETRRSLAVCSAGG